MAESAPKKRRYVAKKKTKKVEPVVEAAAPIVPEPVLAPLPAPIPEPVASLLDSIIADLGDIPLIKMERDLCAGVSRQLKRTVSREEVYLAMILEYKKQCASYGPAALAHRLFQQLKLGKRV